MKSALYGKDKDTPKESYRQNLDESIGIEFPLNTSGVVEEDEILAASSKDAIQFSAGTIEISDTGSNSHQRTSYVEYQEDKNAKNEGIPFTVIE